MHILRGELAAASEFAGRGDLDRLLTEWRSLLRLENPARASHRFAHGYKNGG